MQWISLKFRIRQIAEKRKTAKKERLEKWHKWFAWHPVQVDTNHTIVWGQIIYRRCEFLRNEFCGEYILTYYSFRKSILETKEDSDDPVFSQKSFGKTSDGAKVLYAIIMIASFLSFYSVFGTLFDCRGC